MADADRHAPIRFLRTLFDDRGGSRLHQAAACGRHTILRLDEYDAHARVHPSKGSRPFHGGQALANRLTFVGRAFVKDGDIEAAVKTRLS